MADQLRMDGYEGVSHGATRVLNGLEHLGPGTGAIAAPPRQSGGYDTCAWCREFRGLTLGANGQSFYCWRHLAAAGGPYDGGGH